MTAHALIGIKVTILESDFEQRREATCNHDFIDEMEDDVMFCPKCGSKVTVQGGKLLEFGDIESFVDHLETESAKDRLHPDLMVVNCYDEYDDLNVEEESGLIFVGMGVSTDNEDYAMMEPPQIDFVRRYVRDLLEPYGLYDSKNVGLWAVDSY